MTDRPASPSAATHDVVIVGGGPAVHCDHQLGALGLQAAEGGRRRAVALEDAVGDVD